MGEVVPSSEHPSPGGKRRGGNNKGRRERFGSVRQLPSGRYQAFYTGPDKKIYRAPTTFLREKDAREWLRAEESQVILSLWSPAPAGTAAEPKTVTFSDFAADWLVSRPLKPRTRDEYRKLVGLPKDAGAESRTRDGKRRSTSLIDHFGPLTLDQITPGMVRAWHKQLESSTPTHRAHLYSLLRTILGSAVEEGLLATNPCQIRGAGRVKRAKRIEPASMNTLQVLVEALPDRYQALAELAAWCALRFGELTELRRGDVVLPPPTAPDAPGLVRVRRGVTWVAGEPIVGPPKSDAGARDVAVPPHIVPRVREHIRVHAEPGATGLLFPAVGGGHLNHGTFYKHFRAAREVAGRPDLRLHDLRHTGAVMAAQAGATTKELMERLGHSTVTMAMRYQHVAEGRDAELARKLSEMAGGNRDRA